MKNQILNYWNLLSKWSPLLVVALLFLLLYNCENDRAGDEIYAHNIETLKSKQRDLKLKNGELATQKDLLIVSHKELQKQVWVKDDTIKELLKKIKDPVVVIKWKTKILTDTIPMPFHIIVPCEFERTFKNEDPWYSISGVVNQFGVTLNPPLFPNEQRLVVGYVKGKPTVTITNSNPHIFTEDTEGQIIDIPKKRWVVAAGVGYNYFQDPYFGIFAGHKLFQF